MRWQPAPAVAIGWRRSPMLSSSTTGRFLGFGRVAAGLFQPPHGLSSRVPARACGHGCIANTSMQTTVGCELPTGPPAHPRRLRRRRSACPPVRRPPPPARRAALPPASLAPKPDGELPASGFSCSLSNLPPSCCCGVVVFPSSPSSPPRSRTSRSMLNRRGQYPTRTCEEAATDMHLFRPWLARPPLGNIQRVLTGADAWRIGPRLCVSRHDWPHLSWPVSHPMLHSRLHSTALTGLASRDRIG